LSRVRSHPINSFCSGIEKMLRPHALATAAEMRNGRISGESTR
jgi:hypothetical protein